MNERTALILIANTTIVFSFILGMFFNSTTPTFYPTGTPIPTGPSCDLLSSFTHLCFPSIALPTSVGTIVFNVDILITFLTASGVIFGLFVLHREAPT